MGERVLDFVLCQPSTIGGRHTTISMPLGLDLIMSGSTTQRTLSNQGQGDLFIPTKLKGAGGELSDDLSIVSLRHFLRLGHCFRLLSVCLSVLKGTHRR